jgi:hypothetical protein
MLRPQDTATRERKSLNGLWSFKLDPEGAGRQDRWFAHALTDAREMAVPASFNDVTADRSVRDYVGDIWYQRTVRIPRGWDGQRIALYFESATHRATVWVDETEVVSHEGGYTPFEADLTAHVQAGQEVLVTVVVNNALTFQSIPPGVTEDSPTGPKLIYWHDATLEIRGPAISHVLDVFSERWDDPTPLDHRNPYRALLRVASRMPRHPRPLPKRWDAPPESGSHLVQILRTYPAKRPPFPFAPHGERTIAQAYERAFARARRLVYIEDQYFWSEVVTGTLAEALRREPRLQVIAVVPRFPEEDSVTSGTPMRLGQHRARDLLRQAGGARFVMYDVQNSAGTPVYVHAKVCIVDDEWMTCGSDNLNLRSWTHDSEVTCAVVDPGGQLPREFRASVWAEHLSLSPDDPRLLDLDHATSLWAGRAEQPGARIRPHVLAPVRRAVRMWAAPAYRILFDPDGRPRGLRGTNNF